MRALLPWVVVGIALLGAGLWWWHRSSGAHPAVAARSEPGLTSTPSDSALTTEAANPASQSPAAASSPQTILELLSAARVQFHDQKLLFPRPEGEPRGDSALELYAQVLSQDPSNAEALDGIERLWAIAKERIQGDIAGGKLDDATRLMGLFKAAGLSDELLQPLSAGINAARPRVLLARAQQSIDAGDVASAEQLIAQLVASGADADTLLGLRHAMDAKRQEQQLSALASQLQSAIAAGALLTPEDGSAMARLNGMRSLNRNHALTLAAQRELRTALLTRATQATQQHQFDLATRYLSAAAEVGSASEIADAKRQLQEEMDRGRARAQQAAAALPPAGESRARRRPPRHLAPRSRALSRPRRSDRSMSTTPPKASRVT